MKSKELMRVDTPPADDDLGELANSTVIAAVRISQIGTINAANPRFRELTGDDPRGESFRDFLAVEDHWSACAAAMAAGGGPVAVRVGSPARSVGLRGELVAVRSSGGTEFLGVFADTAQEDELRTAVQRSARMEALGSLTAGIAHDFNNLLTVLVGNLYLVAEDVRGTPKLFDKVKAARDAAKRGSDLIRQLLEFARRDDAQRSTVDPGKIVADVAPLLRRALGKRIALETNLEATGALRASRAQLESAVVNLAVNARDAIEGKGTVTVAVRDIAVSTAEAARRRLPAAGDYVEIEVADTGSGIAPEILDRVFEPFFSTKGDRGGTGLGLSMVRWFAEQNGGAVQIRSKLQEGTTVVLMLPRAAEAQVEAADGTMPLSILPTGTEHVLVCAAEEGLRATIKQILEVLGYTVRFAAAEDMPAALRGTAADLLLLDGAVDEQAIEATVAEARRLRPEIRIIVTGEGGVRGRSAFPVLLKPFSLAELASVVRQALDRK